MTGSGLMISSCRLSRKYKGRASREIVGYSAALQSHLQIAPEAPNWVLQQKINPRSMVKITASR